MKSSTLALYHAAPSTLARVDQVQARFLQEVGPTDHEALKDFWLAPLKSRRDMGMLGVLHKVNLGVAPVQIEKLFPRLGCTEETGWKQRLRFWRPLHSRQLATPVDASSSEVLRRSLFGLVACYNGLPQSFVDEVSVKTFQRRLQLGLLRLAELGAEDWGLLYSSAWRRFPRTKLDGALGLRS